MSVICSATSCFFFSDILIPTKNPAGVLFSIVEFCTSLLLNGSQWHYNEVQSLNAQPAHFPEMLHCLNVTLVVNRKKVPRKTERL